MQKVIAKIHLGNIRKNAEQFLALTDKKLCAVVKANAYGHGAEEVVNALEGVVDCFAVAMIAEAMEIRTAACGKDILIFTPPLCEEDVLMMAWNNFTATIPDLWTARLVSDVCARRCVSIKAHLKTNTGMNRYGMHASMLGKVCKLLCINSLVRVEGIYTHLYAYTKQSAQEQRALFENHVRICRRYFSNIITHLGGTYGALLGKDFCMDMARVGIGLYGYLPDGIEPIDERILATLTLQKGMDVWGRVVTNRKIAYGGVGYGKADGGKKIKGKQVEICRFGYADGFLRKADNGVCGFEKNSNHLCMDVCIREGVKRRGGWIPIMTDAAQTARIVGTITHEVLCAATRRAECIYDE